MISSLDANAKTEKQKMLDEEYFYALEKGLVDCVSRGVSKDELVKTLMETFNVGYRKADRIARTELSYV